jgi:phasin
MIDNTSAAKARSAMSDRPMKDATHDVREAAQRGAAVANEMYEKTQAVTGETQKVLEQSYSAAAKVTADFNRQCIEMARINTNSALDFFREMVAAKSPSEFVELSAAHTRKQLEVYAEQSKQLLGLAQKAAADAVQPLQAAAKSVMAKAS